MYAYFRLIIIKSLTLRYAADPVFRPFSDLDIFLGFQFKMAFIDKFILLVEVSLAHLMSGTQGAIVPDGWTRDGAPFFGMFNELVHNVKLMKDFVEVEAGEHCMPLLAVIPFSKEVTEYDLSADESERFDAKAHLNHLVQTLNLFKQYLYQWFLCFISEKFSVDNCLTELLHVPHVGCMSQKLNSEVREMVKVDNFLSNTID